jgi:branched-chain amino acid transport system ATP-binding protein
VVGPDDGLQAAPDDGSSRALLSMVQCHVRYGLVPALRGVTLYVEPGEMVALLGANGAGKSSTLRTISGMVPPSGGQIIFDGDRIDGLNAPQVVRRGIAHLPEGRELFPGLSVSENLRYGYWPRRSERHGFKSQLDRIHEVFPRLHERRAQKAGTLSGGEQQMLAVGMALMSQPRLLLVDELSLGLAPMVVSQLYGVLRAVNEAGTAILLVEQFVPLALANTSRAYVLSKGTVVMAQASATLKDDPALLESYLGSSSVEHEQAAASATVSTTRAGV